MKAQTAGYDASSHRSSATASTQQSQVIQQRRQSHRQQLQQQQLQKPPQFRPPPRHGQNLRDDGEPTKRASRSSAPQSHRSGQGSIFTTRAAPVGAPGNVPALKLSQGGNGGNCAQQAPLSKRDQVWEARKQAHVDKNRPDNAFYIPPAVDATGQSSERLVLRSSDGRSRVRDTHVPTSC